MGQRLMTVAPASASRLVSQPSNSPVAELRARRRPSWRRAALATGCVAVVTPYLLALGSPLRLFDDAVTYLSLADGSRLPGQHQVYPPGYPALLRIAEHIGLGSAW